mmetsp:Transcript_9827/g.27609  ORF Transcript_9827/g.27609 Transcript_9827/m.27609 type:complete len:201 (+) Transcript_9827:336-938(+)
MRRAPMGSRIHMTRSPRMANVRPKVFETTSLRWSTASAAQDVLTFLREKQRRKRRNLEKTVMPMITSVSKVTSKLSLPPSAITCTDSTTSWKVATNMAVAKIMTPSGSMRRFPAGYKYGSCRLRSRLVMKMTAPERRSRKESSTEARTESELESMKATIFSTSRHMFVNRLSQMASFTRRFSSSSSSSRSSPASSSFRNS